MSHGGPPPAGGSLRLDVLDPSIATVLTRAKRPPGALLSSTTGRLVDATNALMGHLEGVWTGRGGIHGPTILPRHDADTFGRTLSLEPFKGRLMSDERIDELQSLTFFVKQPVERPPDHETEEKMQETAPQFTLRNIDRKEYDMRYPGGAFRDELWRDADEYAIAFGSDSVLTYAPPDMSYTFSWEILKESRELLDKTIRVEPWEQYEGQWKHLVRDAAVNLPGFSSEVRRVKGRFATPDEHLDEINEDLTRKYKRMPLQIWDIYRYRG